MTPYNLDSPNAIQEPCILEDLSAWYRREVSIIEELHIQELLIDVVLNIDSFVQFPTTALLLWKGCNRVPVPPRKQKYHQYPNDLKRTAKQKGIKLDGRPNGPAIAAYTFGGGKRPNRYGSENQWSIHHLYSGKFPYPDRKDSLHAAKNGHHFTQSAGLVAVHPVADALSDEYPFFSWRLRAEAFIRFGYDPDRVFGESPIDAFGFVKGSDMKVLIDSGLA